MQFDQLSQSVSINRPVSKDFIKAVLTGSARHNDVTTYEQYDNIFKIRHDSIHWLICDSREIPFGERKISSFQFNDQVINHRHYDLIKNQTPDILMIKGKIVNISELTISRMKQADIPKITKYKLLVNILQQAGYEVNLEIIVINCMFSIPDQSFLVTEYGFSTQLVDQMYQIIRNVESLLHQINDTPIGLEWIAKHRGNSLEQVDFNITDDDVIRFHNGVDRKVFHNDDDLKSILQSDEPLALTNEDDSLIDYLVSQAVDVKSPLSRSQDVKAGVASVREHHEKCKNNILDRDLRSFFPLPYIEHLIEDSAKRHIVDDMVIVEKAFGAFASSPDPFFSAISKSEHSVLFKAKLSSEIRFIMALDGPGRKTFVRKGSIPHILRQKARSAIWYPVSSDFDNEILSISRLFSQVSGDSITNLRGIGLDYLRVCQSIFREVNINAMRNERRKLYCLKPTGVAGLLILIFPGVKLRTGENLSTIWFRVIALHDYWKKTTTSNSWVFKKLNQDVNFSYSDWLSTDANRLDHYIRCYDKVLMSYACYSSFTPRSLTEEMTLCLSNTLGIIIMIYMEDKRSTSKMLQDVRYLIMSILSMFVYYEDILKKFLDPIRTPLQSYLLNKILKYSTNDEVRQMVLSSKFGKLNVESGTGETFDRMAGVQIMLPRILTDGPPVEFRQILCEMYFTMLFNKNQDDPTHASFQILSKILEGEKSLDNVKKTSGLHMGFKTDTFSDLEVLIQTPHKNQFSRRAIIIASKLQAKSQFNKANSGIAHKLASTSNHINKYLDEFATFKSSSTFQNEFYNPKVYTTARLDDQELDEKDIKHRLSGDRNSQNRRRRCLEGVQELLDSGYMRSFDLVRKHLYEPFIFQIFKKNQIGGVREILILDIHKRVLTNILESFSRVICSDDDREMLTHGDRKVSLMRDLIRDLKRGDGKKIIMNYNFDKTKWAPSFMPIQFLYMFLPFRKMYPSLFRFICVSLINHSNKKFLLPEKLLRAWRNDLNNDHEHMMDPNLQSLKEEFIRTKSLAYTNESNMGQGILHYTSSYFHLCFISLRDEVYKRLCRKLNITPGEWRDLVSSDDSYTAHALPMDTTKNVKYRIHLFLKAQEVTERVMNVWTSASKSSISMLIYEFNSLFGSNLTMYPTTFKFALAAVHPVNTDSFFRMVKESYIASRQIVENGGSLELYTLASKLNKEYCESIYHTHPGGQNDLALFGLRPEFTPYQLGIYPIMDPAVMIMFGPECQNYKILMKQDQMNPVENQVFSVMHTLVDVQDPAIYASTTSVDDIMVGVNRIEAHMGPIKRLEYIKRNIPMKLDEVQDVISHNPLLLFADPKSMKELQAKIYIKLYQKGAAEALRTTAASIYYARVAASVSAKAFTIPMVMQGKKTYHECMEHLVNLEASPLDLKLLYPHLMEFETVDRLTSIEFDYIPREGLETQNIRTLQLNRLQQRIHNPIVKLLRHYWMHEDELDPPSSYFRDWINIQESLPVIKDTLEETLESFKGDKSKQISSLLLVLLRLMSYSSKPMKAIVYGPSSRAYDHTYLILKQQNMYAASTSVESRGAYMAGNITRITDKLSFAYNIFSLSVLLGHTEKGVEMKNPINVDSYIDEEEMRAFFLDNSASIATYKKILLMLLYHGRVSDVSSWSKKTRNIFHQWLKRGNPIIDQNGRKYYEGSYTLKSQLGTTILMTTYDKFLDRIKLTINELSNMTIVKELIDHSIENSNMTSAFFWKKVGKGPYLYTSDQINISTRDDGFQFKISGLSPVEYHPGTVTWVNGYVTLNDSDGEPILRTVEGLLHTDYCPKDFTWDMKLTGMSLRALLPFRPFNTHFNIEVISTADLCRLIQNGSAPSPSDLEVPKPNVSGITNKRLKINYPIRELEAEFSDVVIESDEKEAPSLSMDEIFDRYMQVDTDDLIRNLESIMLEPDCSTTDSWMDPTIDINLIKTMTKQRITYQPKRILERTLHLKYQILTRMVTDSNMINRRVIAAVKRQTGNVNLVYSLIYSYDRQFTNTETPSPHGCELRINGTFDQIYDIQKEDEDF